MMLMSRRQCEQRLVSGDTRKQRTTSFPRLQTLQDQILGIVSIISGSLFEGFRKKRNKQERKWQQRSLFRPTRPRSGPCRGWNKRSFSFPYLSGELQTHDEIRLDSCSLTHHFVVLCERIRGRHRVPKRLLNNYKHHRWQRDGSRNHG